MEYIKYTGYYISENNIIDENGNPTGYSISNTLCQKILGLDGKETGYYLGGIFNSTIYTNNEENTEYFLGGIFINRIYGPEKNLPWMNISLEDNINDVFDEIIKKQQDTLHEELRILKLIMTSKLFV